MVKSKTSVGQETLDAVYEKMKSLRVTLKQGVQPYPQLAGFYETLETVNSGKLIDLANIQINLPESGGQSAIDSRLIVELQGLIVAKSLANHPEYRAKGIELLKMLVQRGNVVSVAAFSSLVGLAATFEEKKELKAMLPGVTQQQPWQQAELEKLASQITLAVESEVKG